MRTQHIQTYTQSSWRARGLHAHEAAFTHTHMCVRTHVYPYIYTDTPMGARAVPGGAAGQGRDRHCASGGAQPFGEAWPTEPARAGAAGRPPKAEFIGDAPAGQAEGGAGGAGWEAPQAGTAAGIGAHVRHGGRHEVRGAAGNSHGSHGCAVGTPGAQRTEAGGGAGATAAGGACAAWSAGGTRSGGAGGAGSSRGCTEAVAGAEGVGGEGGAAAGGAPAGRATRNAPAAVLDLGAAILEEVALW